MLERPSKEENTKNTQEPNYSTFQWVGKSFATRMALIALYFKKPQL